MQKQLAITLSLVALLATLPAGAAADATGGQGQPAQLADKIKSMTRRDARASELVPKAEAKIAELKANPAWQRYSKRIADEFEEITMIGPVMPDARLKNDMDLLEALCAAKAPPSASDLKPLQERYAKVAAKLDDSILFKDYDRVLKRHDKLVRYTALGIWDKDKIAGELAKIEEMMESAPDLPFGRSEMLRNLQDRKLVAVPKLYYIGNFPHEEEYISADRRAVGVLEESAGGANMKMETADMVIQGPDGALIDLTAANHPYLGLPFSPPLSVWLKARMLEGRVPSITFRLVDDAVSDHYRELDKDYVAQPAQIMHLTDVLDGKLDDYFKRNFKTIADTKEASLIGLFSNFDRQLAANSFGADGRTPFYALFDDKIAKLPVDKQQEEFVKRTEKGLFTKSVPADLCKYYGDANVPDGPERVRDAWKRVHDLLVATGAKNIGFYSTAGAFHGSPIALKIPALRQAGTQAWNKLEYYWPGEGVMDWLGTSAYGSTAELDPKGANIYKAMEGFMAEHRSSGWQSTPVMLRGLGLVENGHDPGHEADWFAQMFMQIVPATFPVISIVYLDMPGSLTLWDGLARTSYRDNVSSNKQYKYPLRFKMLTAESH